MRGRIFIAALAATSIYAGVVTFGGAWDNLPCGATEETAHVCIPGEVARDGTVPNPLPTPAPTPVPPEVVPAASPPPPPSVVTPPAPHRQQQREITVPRSCGWLERHHAGIGRFTSHHPRCKIPARFRHPSPPLVTGSLEPLATVVNQGGYTVTAFRPFRMNGITGRATGAKARSAARGGRFQVQLLRNGTVVVGSEFLIPKPNVTYTASVSTGAAVVGRSTYVTRTRIVFPSTGVTSPWARSPGVVL